MKDVESPELFIDWGFYAMISTALQRRVWYFEGAQSIFLNQYVILVGPPSTGKGRVLTQVQHVLRNTKLCTTERVNNVPIAHPMYPIGSDSPTLPDLTKSLATTYCRSFEYISTLSGKKVLAAHSSVGFIIEELSMMFRTDTRDLVNALMGLYDSGSFTRSTKGNGVDEIRNACICFLAGTTPKFMHDSMTENLIGEGMASRVIFVYQEGSRFLRAARPVTLEQMHCINQVVTWMHGLHKVVGSLHFTPEADKMRIDEYESGRLTIDRVNTSQSLLYYYGRKQLHWLKLAAAIHFSRDTSMAITEQDLIEAKEVLARTEVLMHVPFSFIASANYGARIAIMIQDAIRNSAKPLMRKGLLGLLVGKISNLEAFDAALALLTEAGAIKVTSAGVFQLTGDAAKRPATLATTNENKTTTTI